MPTKTKLRLSQISGSLTDNSANAFAFENDGGTINYLKFVTTDDSEAVILGNTGKTITMNGNVGGDALETNLASSAASNKLATASAIKTYVDGVAQGLDVHDSVRMATTSTVEMSYNATNNTLTEIHDSSTATFGSTNNIDGQAVTFNSTEASAHRVLFKDFNANTVKAQGVLTFNNVAVPNDKDSITFFAANSAASGEPCIIRLSFDNANTVNPQSAPFGNITDLDLSDEGYSNHAIDILFHTGHNDNDTGEELADDVRRVLAHLVGNTEQNIRLGGYEGAASGQALENVVSDGTDRKVTLLAAVDPTVSNQQSEIRLKEDIAANLSLAITAPQVDHRPAQGIYYAKTAGVAKTRANLTITVGSGGSDANIPADDDQIKVTGSQISAADQEVFIFFDAGGRKGEGKLLLGDGAGDSAANIGTGTIKFVNASGHKAHIIFTNSGGSGSAFAANGLSAGEVSITIDRTDAATDTVSEIATVLQTAFNALNNGAVNGADFTIFEDAQVIGSEPGGKRLLLFRAEAGGTAGSVTVEGGAGVTNAVGSVTAGNASQASDTQFGSSGNAFPNGTARLRIQTSDAGADDANEIAGVLQAAFLDLVGNARNGVQFNAYSVGSVGGSAGARAFTITANEDFTGRSMSHRNLAYTETVGAANIAGVAVGGAEGSAAVYERAQDAIAANDLQPGSFFFVETGTQNADNGFVMTADTAMSANNAATALTFSQFSGAGSITAGEGIAKSGATLSLDINGLSNSGDDLATGDLFAYYDADAARVEKISAQTFLTAIGGTGLSRSGATLAVDASQAITALTGGDLTIFDDQNNADVSLSMGTGAAEALVIEVLNGGSNKLAESVKFSSKTTGTGVNDGKFTFSPDEADVLHIDDGGIDFESGMAISHGGTDTLTATALGTNVVSSALTSLGTLVGLTLDGDKNITPGDGSMIHLDTSELTDNQTGASGTAPKFASVAFEAPTLSATNSSVTTTDAATVYINAAPIAGTNQTLTRNYALWADAGKVRFDGGIMAGTTDIINGSGEILVAAQPNITSVGTLASIELGATDTTLTRSAAGLLAVENAIVGSRTVKHIHVVTGSGLPANTPYFANMGDISGMMDHHGTLRTKTAGELDVYVNGQLLVGADAAGDDFDYYPGGDAPSDNTCIAFEFALDAGDVIQLHLRDGSV